MLARRVLVLVVLLTPPLAGAETPVETARALVARYHEAGADRGWPAADPYGVIVAGSAWSGVREAGADRGWPEPGARGVVLDTRRRGRRCCPRERPAVPPESRGAMRVLRALAVIAVAGWLGIMAFFAFGVAPLVFRAIDRAVAGEAVAAVLPSYYAWGLALCALALVATVIQVVSGADGRLRPLGSAALCAVMLGLLVWADTVVLPRAEAARRAHEDGAFARAHRAAVQLNGATMVAGARLPRLEAFSLGRRRSR